VKDTTPPGQLIFAGRVHRNPPNSRTIRAATETRINSRFIMLCEPG
jgi:hypothetical protein